jgi:hypothetical protein
LTATSGRSRRRAGRRAARSSPNSIEVRTAGCWFFSTGTTQLEGWPAQPANSQTALLDLRTGRKTWLRAGNAVAYEWSPNGRRLALWSYTDLLPADRNRQEDVYIFAVPR